MKNLTCTEICEGNKRGQIMLAFLGFFPLFIVCLFVVTDLARYFYLKNQVRITADSAALAAAGALDMRQATENQVFVINGAWGSIRAMEVVLETQGKVSEDSWMTIGITYLDIQGDEVTVIVNGKGQAGWYKNGRLTTNRCRVGSDYYHHRGNILLHRIRR
ncbi:MAG: pilus assembly protein TadG-related protein [Anaerolineales bacterium]